MLMQYKVIFASAVEVTYAVVTRTWLRQHLDGAYLELAVSAFRVATIVVYWGLFQDLVRSRAKASNTLRHPLLVVGIATALAIPFLFRGWSPGGGLGTAIVFALTSIVVGLREEILYRCVLLNLMQPRIGVIGSLLCSTVIFIVYHYGAQPFTVLWITECTCMSLLLGLIYIRSGSLLTVAAIHALYDGIWVLGPYLSTPIPDIWRPVFQCSALALVVAWWRFGAHAPNSTVIRGT
ncbi:MAG: CPBP family intramembrane metalloprotease [Rhodoferax sp.]|jgi:membrane protease YdiL (CAAX protease family)|nr:CPBP family intramembrane metalloprotease [Rhodoferax sp.]